MTKLRYKSDYQKDQYTSSWSIKEIIGIRLWKIIWCIFASWTPKIFNRWRVFLLTLFGARVDTNVFIYSSAKIYVPWLLTMKNRSCLGPHSEIYNLGLVYIHSKVTISQYVYICNGTHDFSDTKSPLMIGDIIIEKETFIGAKALILPGVNVGEYAIIGAGSVVTKDVEPWSVVGGNPAKFIKKREIKE